jgi:hypothetical protein
MRPCEYRTALDDGRIVCDKITEGSPEVNPNICRNCPLAVINCSHLRFTLRKVGHKPILVRFGNGASDVWDDDPPAVELMRGACAEKVKPITGHRDCVGCEAQCPMWDHVPLQTPMPREAIAARANNVIRFPATPDRVDHGREMPPHLPPPPHYREATGTEGSAELG